MTQLLIKTVADFSTTLTSKVAIGATTATLTSGIDADGVQLPTGVYGFTIDRNNTQKEHFTATLTGDALTDIKTVTRGTGVGTAGFVRTHRKGAEIVITDHVALKRMMNVLDGTTSFDSATPLGYDGAPTISTGNQFATKTYVDGVAIAGGTDATTTIKGISKMSVTPVSASEPIAVGQNDPQFVNYFTETGSANAYVITPSPSIGAYAVGQRFSFKATNANTTTSTVNINGLGAKTIKKLGGSVDLVSGDIATDMIVTVEYDGTNFLMLNPVANESLSPTGDGSGLTGVLKINYAQQFCAFGGTVMTTLTGFATSKPDGSEICTLHANIVTGTGWTITRLAKDSTTNNWYIVEQATFNVGTSNTTTSGASLAYVGSFIYAVFYDGGAPARYCNRWSATNLSAGATAISISGTTFGTSLSCYSDGTDLYVWGTGTSWYRYTISGTTITNAQTLTGPGLVKAVSDGTKVYTYNGITFSRYAHSLGSAEASTTGTRIGAAIGTNVNPAAGITFLNSTVLAAVSLSSSSAHNMMVVTPFAKP